MIPRFSPPHRHRPSPQPGIRRLFDRGEERVRIQMDNSPRHRRN